VFWTGEHWQSIRSSCVQIGAWNNSLLDILIGAVHPDRVDCRADSVSEEEKQFPHSQVKNLGEIELSVLVP